MEGSRSDSLHQLGKPLPSKYLENLKQEKHIGLTSTKMFLSFDKLTSNMLSDNLV